MRLHPICPIAALLALSLPSAFAESPYKLVVFGDSLSDNGNAAAALASVGQTLGNYAPNEFTDGPHTNPPTAGPYGLWIDQFAGLLQTPDPEPFVVFTPSGKSGGRLSVNPTGTNFAVASALAGNNPNFSPANFLTPGYTQVPGTTNQVELYLSFNDKKASPQDLYVFWAGSNNIYQSLSNESSFKDLPGIAIDAADDIAGNIATLAKAGAKYFLWLNLPPVGEVPYIEDNPSAVIRNLGKEAADGAALAFNAELISDVYALRNKYGIELIVVNTNSLFNAIIGDPKCYGFANVKDAGWCGTDGLSTCAEDNPNGFLFWDELHPTTSANEILAKWAYSNVAGKF